MSNTSKNSKKVVSVFQNIDHPNDNPNKLTFTLSPTDVAYANTLRRLIITKVKTVGFRADMTEDGKTTDVTIYENSTPMTNEMLADRIGLLPLTVANPYAWNSRDYVFELNVKNESSTPKDVFASDIQVLKVDKNKIDEPKLVPNTEFFVPDPITQQTALIAVLKGQRPGQNPETIRLRAIATKGTGREHARFNPTSQCAYKYTVTKENAVIEERLKKWAKDNKKVANDEDFDDKAKYDKLKAEFDTMEIDRCYLEDENGNPYSFDFTIESVGTLSPEQIVKSALDSGVRLCENYINLTVNEKNMNSRQRSKFPRISPAANRINGYDFTFKEEDHTLGNLIQSYMDINMMDADETLLDYVGYYIPHPLRDEMVLRVGVKTGDDIDARKLVSEAAKGCLEMFQNWSIQWSQITGIKGLDEDEDENEEEKNNNNTSTIPEEEEDDE